MLRHGLLNIGWVVAVAVAAPAGAQAPAQEAARNTDGAHLQRLIQALGEDDSFKVRLQAAVLLGRTRADDALPSLVKALNGDEHYAVRVASVMALGHLGRVEAIPEIMKASAVDVDQYVREEAIRALGKFDREEALPYVVAAFGSEDARIRLAVVTYLSLDEIDPADVVMIRALGDRPDIAAASRAAVKGMEPEERLRFLSSAVEHRDPEVRRGAVRALEEENNAPATEVLLRVYERDVEVDQVRVATRDALRKLRAFLPIDRIVRDASSHQDKHARARAIKLLGVVGGDTAQGALFAALADKEVYLRGTAVMALRELGDPAAIPRLEELLVDPANQRIALQIRTAVKHLRRGQNGN